MPKRKDPLAAARAREAVRAAEEDSIQSEAKAQRKREKKGKLRGAITAIQAAAIQQGKDFEAGVYSAGSPLTMASRRKMDAKRRRLAHEKRAKAKRGR